MKATELIRELERLAPPEGAEEWDCCGRLIDPPEERPVRTVLLAIDLTEAVADEALRRKADWIVAYHPIFFGGLQALRATDPQARTALRLIRAGIGVYSPHTALDAAPGGVNDWLAASVDGLVEARGSARVVTLETPVPPETVCRWIKEKRNLAAVQLAGAGRQVRSVAVCAGAGIQALRGIEADLYLTGEMKHHDVLATVASGISVVLCGHSESERGYLPVLAARLRRCCKGVRFVIARSDKAPLKMQ